MGGRFKVLFHPIQTFHLNLICRNAIITTIIEWAHNRSQATIPEAM